MLLTVSKSLTNWCFRCNSLWNLYFFERARRARGITHSASQSNADAVPPHMECIRAHEDVPRCPRVYFLYNNIGEAHMHATHGALCAQPPLPAYPRHVSDIYVINIGYRKYSFVRPSSRLAHLLFWRPGACWASILFGARARGATHYASSNRKVRARDATNTICAPFTRSMATHRPLSIAWTHLAQRIYASLQIAVANRTPACHQSMQTVRGWPNWYREGRTRERSKTRDGERHAIGHELRHSFNSHLRIEPCAPNRQDVIWCARIECVRPHFLFIVYWHLI